MDTPTPLATALHVDQYIQHLRAGRCLRATTLSNYAEDLNDLVRRRCPLTADPLLEFLASGSTGRRLATTSFNRRLTIVRGFLEFLVGEQLLTQNPLKQVKPQRVARRPTAALTPTDVGMLVEAARASPTRWIRARDSAMVHLFFYTGLRLAELLALDLVQVTPDRRLLLGARRKGGLQSDEHLPESARAALSTYLELRPESATDSLFLAAHRGPLTRRGVQKRLARLADLAGLAGRVHPHALRYAHATALDRAGASLPVIQESLNHAFLETTRRYIRNARTEVEAARDKLPRLIADEPSTT